ncbi:MAG: DNA topoisomerase, partial [Clostridia bacterium]|nr:DNA topoisomerase [Clostridia bacterium]
MKLVIAEKPSVARDIARVLGCKPAEGAFANGEYAIVWAVGHLVTLCEPGEANPAWKKWDAAQLPMLPESIPLKVIDKTKTQYSTVKRWMKKRDVTAIICATDAGREGELIFRHIYDMAECKKPVERLWISSLTPPAIKRGFEELRPGTEYDGLHASARCRAEADWLVGMNASRAYSLASGETLSIGRVQTPTLAFLVRRQAEIDIFVPQEYANIIADFGAYFGGFVSDEYADGRVFDLEFAKTVAQRVKGGTGIV